jgi:hypothetical protein
MATTQAVMVATPKSARVVILVKALPHPSKTYGETVCCAGVTDKQEWKRLYPIRFRHLKDASAFKRWDWVKFKYRLPTTDKRRESCYVFEESITIDRKLAERERARFLNPLIVGSAKHAMERGQSLALIRPRNPRFFAKAKSKADIEEEREAFRWAAGQTSMFDEELAEWSPSTYDFKFSFEDDDGSHSYRNGDWEAHAMFWHERQRSSEANALKWMDAKFNDEYPRLGVVFAIGNMAKRPQTWQLLGVIRLNETDQADLPL